MSLKKFLATVVLGGVLLGPNLYAADNSKKTIPPKDEKQIVETDRKTRDAAFKSSLDQFYERLREDMNRHPISKPSPAAKPIDDPYNPKKMGRVVLGVINSQLRTDDDKVSASMNANLAVNNGRLESMVVSGHARLVDAVVSYDFRNRQSTATFSANNKGNRLDFTLRDGKDPLVRALLRVSKEINSVFVFDSRTNYAAVNVAFNHRRIGASVGYENIDDVVRLTTNLSYSPPKSLGIKIISFSHVNFNGVDHYFLNALSRLKPFDIGISARKIGPGKAVYYFVITYSNSKKK
jgi:hypothetical protein